MPDLRKSYINNFAWLPEAPDGGEKYVGKEIFFASEASVGLGLPPFFASLCAT